MTELADIGYDSETGFTLSIVPPSRFLDSSVVKLGGNFPHVLVEAHQTEISV